MFIFIEISFKKNFCLVLFVCLFNSCIYSNPYNIIVNDLSKMELLHINKMETTNSKIEFIKLNIVRSDIYFFQKQLLIDAKDNLYLPVSNFGNIYHTFLFNLSEKKIFNIGYFNPNQPIPEPKGIEKFYYIGSKLEFQNHMDRVFKQSDSSINILGHDVSINPLFGGGLDYIHIEKPFQQPIICQLSENSLVTLIPFVYLSTYSNALKYEASLEIIYCNNFKNLFNILSESDKSKIAINIDPINKTIMTKVINHCIQNPSDFHQFVKKRIFSHFNFINRNYFDNYMYNNILVLLSGYIDKYPEEMQYFFNLQDFPLFDLANNFINKFPYSKNVPVLLLELFENIEDSDWVKCFEMSLKSLTKKDALRFDDMIYKIITSNKSEGYFNLYLQNFPDGKYFNKVSTLKENFYWYNAEKKNNIVFYDIYMNMYPDGKFAHIAKLKKQNLVWQNTIKQNTIEAFDLFIKNYPKSKYLDTVEKIKEELVWKKALEKNTIESYNDYIAKYPKGEFLSIANKNIQSIRFSNYLSMLAKEKQKKEQANAFLEKLAFYTAAGIVICAGVGSLIDMAKAFDSSTDSSGNYHSNNRQFENYSNVLIRASCERFFKIELDSYKILIKQTFDLNGNVANYYSDEIETSGSFFSSTPLFYVPYGVYDVEFNGVYGKKFYSGKWQNITIDLEYIEIDLVYEGQATIIKNSSHF